MKWGLLLLLLVACAPQAQDDSLQTIADQVVVNNIEVEEMRITSPEFSDNENIPSKFTCDGEDVSPELTIEGVPEGAKSLVLIMDDPDAPMGTWDHWVMWNVPVAERIEENSAPGMQGLNSWGRNDYGGPCPPSGTHRYFFKIYALDKELDIPESSKKTDVEAAMEGNIVDKAQFVGLYKRK